MKRLLSFTFLFLLLFSFVPCFADSKIYDIDKININAVILENGDVNVTEYLTYNFSGEFNGIFRDLNSNGSDGCIVNSVVIIDELGTETMAIASNTGEENTYEVLDNEYNTNIKLYSKSLNEKKTFKINYTAKNAAKRYSNNGQLYWNFYTVENIPKVKEANLNISFNNEILNKENSRYMTFGDGELTTSYINNGININYKNLTSIIAVDLTIPEEFLSNATILSNEGNDIIIENQVPHYNNDSQSNTNQGSIIFIFTIAIGGIILILVTILKNIKKYDEGVEAYRKGYDFTLNSKYIEPPSNMSPALVSLLFEKNISSQMLTSTLLYLCNLGYYTMKEYKYTEKLFFSNKEKVDLIFKRNINKKSPNVGHLEFIITWFSLYEIDKEFSLSSIRNILSQSSHRKIFLDKLNEWKLKVNEDAKLQGYYIKIENRDTLTNEFYSEKLKWLSYKHFIQETMNLKESLEDINRIDTILIYAKAVGVENKLIEKYINEIVINIEKLGYDNSESMHYVNRNYYFISYLAYSSSMDSIYYIATPNDSTINDSGGGFSGGGSGGSFDGGGGGGSGAF